MVQPGSDCASVGTALTSSGSATESITLRYCNVIVYSTMSDLMGSQQAVVPGCCLGLCVKQASMNQDKDLKVEVRRGKEKKVKPRFKGTLGWVFWLASPFIRAWHRHRVVLACTPYG